VDPYKNFSYGTVQVASTIIGSTANPATIILESGRGADFPGGDGSTQFDALIWPGDERPLSTNAEFVRVTRSGDTLTTTARGAQGTTPLAGIAAGYQVAVGMSAGLLDQIRDSVSSVSQDWAISGVLTPPTLTGNQDNYNPAGMDSATMLRLSSDATRSITSIQAGTAGRVLKLINIGAFKILLLAETGGTATNRLALDDDVALWPLDTATLWYDQTSTRWRLDSRSRSEPPGKVTFTAGLSVPQGYLFADGEEYLRTDYPALFSELNPLEGTVTISIGSPGTFTRASHNLRTGDAIFLTTTGGLPTGLNPNFQYFVTVLTTNTFRVALTRTDAVNGNNLNLAGSQSGVHSLYRTPFGNGDGTTTFNVPDMIGRAPFGAPSVGVVAHPDITLGNTDGVVVGNRSAKHNHGHALTLPAHTHSAGSYVMPDHSHTHSLTLPNHSHSVTDPGHRHTSSDGTSSFVLFKNGGNNDVGGSGTAYNPSAFTATATTGITIGNPSSLPAIGGSIGSATSSPAITGTSGGVTSSPAISGSVGPGGTLPQDAPGFAVLTPIIKT
jgi:microcystin-dependent protein